MPSQIRLGGRIVPLSLSGESETKNDYINLALDDEYGLESLAGAPKTVIDIGANIGLFSMLASHYFPSATIHAYEPNPKTFLHTQRNLAQVNASPFNVGLGSRAGLAELRANDDSRLAQTVLKTDGSVRIDALSDAIARIGGNVDLVKIDCEGAEWELFKDSLSFQKIQAIRMEYHLTDGHTLDEVKIAITGLGYNIDRLEPNDGFGILWASRTAPRG